MPSKLLSAIVTLLGTSALASAQTSGAVNSNDPASPAPPAVSSPWDLSSTLRASAGWRENVTISSVHSIDRAFWRTEVDGFAVRPLGEHWRTVSFISGDVLRYFEAPSGVAGEQEWIADLETRWQPAASFRGTLKAVGFFDDTFIDPAQTEGELLPAVWVRLQGGYVLATPRISLPFGFALEPSLQEKRVDYKRGYAGDNTEARPGVRLEWSKFKALTLSAAWFEHHRHYQHLNANALSGRVLRDRRLGVRQHEAELKAVTTWTAHGTWTVTATGSSLQNRDRALGFLDFDQRRGRLDLQWDNNGWRITLTGDWRRLKYLHQTVGFGLNVSPRIGTIAEGTLRFEHDLSKRWTLFGELQSEHDRSNIPDDLAYRFSYRTATASAGIQRTF